MTTGPFDWVAERARNRALVGLTVLLATCSVWLMWMDRSLVSAAAPQGIISFELARTLEQSTLILNSWSPDTRMIAMLIQGFDYLYLLVYPAWFSIVSARLGLFLGGAWGFTGLLVSWLVLVAAPLDAIENYALIQQLLHGPDAYLASLAWWCAVPKFALIAVAVAFVLLAAGVGLARRPRNS